MADITVEVFPAKEIVTGKLSPFLRGLDLVSIKKDEKGEKCSSYLTEKSWWRPASINHSIYTQGDAFYFGSRQFLPWVVVMCSAVDLPGYAYTAACSLCSLGVFFFPASTWYQGCRSIPGAGGVPCRDGIYTMSKWHWRKCCRAKSGSKVEADEFP